MQFLLYEKLLWKNQLLRGSSIQSWVISVANVEETEGRVEEVSRGMSQDLFRKEFECPNKHCREHFLAQIDIR